MLSRAAAVGVVVRLEHGIAQQLSVIGDRTKVFKEFQQQKTLRSLIGNIVGEGGDHLANHVRASLLLPKHVLKCSKVFLDTLEALTLFGG